MVTTIDGRPRLVTKAPLNAPHSTPVRIPTATKPGVPTPNCSANPIIVDENAMIAATDRSISPEIITSAIASAISAFSVKLNVASDSDQGDKKYGVAKQFTIKMDTATRNKSDCHDNRADRSGWLSRSGIRRLLGGVSIIDQTSHLSR